MFSRIWTETSTGNYLKNVDSLYNTLNTADAVVIGAGRRTFGLRRIHLQRRQI